MNRNQRKVEIADLELCDLWRVNSPTFVGDDTARVILLVSYEQRKRVAQRNPGLIPKAVIHCVRGVEEGTLPRDRASWQQSAQQIGRIRIRSSFLCEYPIR